MVNLCSNHSKSKVGFVKLKVFAFLCELDLEESEFARISLRSCRLLSYFWFAVVGLQYLSYFLKLVCFILSTSVISNVTTCLCVKN